MGKEKPLIAYAGKIRGNPEIVRIFEYYHSRATGSERDKETGDEIASVTISDDETRPDIISGRKDWYSPNRMLHLEERLTAKLRREKRKKK